MSHPGSDDLIPVESLDDIPTFANEDEEHEFWSTHSFGEGLLNLMGPLDDAALPPPRLRRRRITTSIAQFARVVPAQPRKPKNVVRQTEIVFDEHRSWLRAS